MPHALIASATPEELIAAQEAADWALDAIAAATQSRVFLRGETEYDDLIGEAVLLNVEVACIRAIRALANNKGEDK